MGEGRSEREEGGRMDWRATGVRAGVWRWATPKLQRGVWLLNSRASLALAFYFNFRNRGNQYAAFSSKGCNDSVARID